MSAKPFWIDEEPCDPRPRPCATPGCRRETIIGKTCPRCLEDDDQAKFVGDWERRNVDRHFWHRQRFWWIRELNAADWILLVLFLFALNFVVIEISVPFLMFWGGI